MNGICSICERHRDLRAGVCWNCVEAESIIDEGLDMRDKGLDDKDGESTPAVTAMDKVRLLVTRGLLAVFLLTASVAAGDWYPAGDCLDTGSMKDHDTARYYAKVDTVLSCPECWELLEWCLMDDTASHVPLPEVCVRDRWSYVVIPDTILDTIWLPKIQVWLDPTRYKKLMEMLR